VQLPLPVPLVVGQLVERAGEARARVVDEDVYGLAGPLGDALRRLGVGDVDARGSRHADHVCALGLEQADGRGADAAARARHHGRPAFDPEVHAREFYPAKRRATCSAEAP
jgi:hypothetical protein